MDTPPRDWFRVSRPVYALIMAVLAALVVWQARVAGRVARHNRVVFVDGSRHLVPLTGCITLMQVSSIFIP